MIIECGVCGKEFEKVGKRIYCSEECSKAAKWQKKYVHERQIRKNKKRLQKLRELLEKSPKNGRL